MSFNIISFLKAATRQAVPVADDQPLPITGTGTAGTAAAGVQTVQGIAGGTPVAVQQGTPPVGGGITYTDKTITSATGSSQTLAASNAARKSILIKNGGSATGVNINGGTAVIGGAATITLQPFESLFLSGADCPVGAITVISTATAYVSAYEGA